MRTLVPNPSSGAPRFSKQRRPFLEPIAYPKEYPHFEKPPLTNNVNLTLPLRAVLPEDADRAEAEGRLVFHLSGDTGSIHGDNSQVAIAEAMEQQVKSATDAKRPAFLYNLGDVVYFNGQSELYPSQFYEPYQYYPSPIFAIAGNHDGDTRVRPGDEPDTEPSLYGFMENFCSAQARHISPYRPTMTQPYVYWTLEAPLITIIGLYSNVEGTLDARGTYEQHRWLEDQLHTAAKSDCFILVAVHHPPYSLDRTHGGSPDIAAALDEAMRTTGVKPHAVVSGHVHDYQRFTRALDGRQIPYIVDGRGGYANDARLVHKLQKGDNGDPPEKGAQTPSEQDRELDLKIEGYDQARVSAGDGDPGRADDRILLHAVRWPVRRSAAGCGDGNQRWSAGWQWLTGRRHPTASRRSAPLKRS